MIRKKWLYRMVLMIVMVLCLCPVAAWGKSRRVRLNRKKLTLEQGSNYHLKVRGAKKVKWSSNKKWVAKVSKKGVVKARHCGKAKITAKVKGKKYVCKVRVVARKETQKKKTHNKKTENRKNNADETAAKSPAKATTKNQVENQRIIVSDSTTAGQPPADQQQIEAPAGQQIPNAADMPFSFAAGSSLEWDVNMTYVLKLNCEKDFVEGWRTEWTVSDESILEIDYGIYDQAWIKTLDGGDVTVTAVNGGRRAQIQIHVNKEPEVEYSYRIRVLNNPAYHLYCYESEHVQAGCRMFYLIETDNPNVRSLSVQLHEPEGSYRMSVSNPYKDIYGWDSMITNGLNPVRGGYLQMVEYRMPGTKTLTLYETINHNKKEVAHCQVEIEEGSAAYEAWRESVREEVTSPKNSPRENAGKIMQWLKTHFKYSYHDGQDNGIELISATGPVWERMRMECTTATGIMCDFLEDLGIENESRQTGGHVYAVGIIDGKISSFDACPDPDTGFVNHEWEYLN